MKSNIKNKVKVDENKIILSIGMIVKNEEKHLDNCLSALQKLRDKVPNELIIVDTGSTDRTKEIALKYTDKVYDFEWINDFAAARNCGLEKATGEWFMFIDADEYLDEDCDEMVKFFTIPEVNKQYNSASFILRNYGGESKRATNQFYAPRIVRNYEGLKFYDAIHEWLPQSFPHGYFSTVFHHYGYIFESKSQRDKKAKRNMEPLLEEYKEKPTDLRVLYHVCDAIFNDDYFKTAEEKEKYLNEYLEEAKKRITEPYAFGGYIKYGHYYLVYNRFKESAEILSEFTKIECAQNSIVMLTAYYYLSKAYLNLEDDEKTFEAIEKYIEYFNKYNNNELNLVDMRFGTIHGATQSDVDEMVIFAAKCLNNLDRQDEVLKYLDMLDLSEMSYANIKIYLNVMRDIFPKTKEYGYVVNCYEKMLELGDDDKTGLVLFMLEQYYMEHERERENFIEQVVKTGTKGKYVQLAKIIKDDMDGKDVSKKISEFINSVDRWNDGYAEAIFIAMKHGADVMPAVEKMSHKLVGEILTIIAEGHPYDYAKVALDYCSEFDYAAGIRQMFWCVSALEAAVNIANELDNEDKPVFYDFFVSLLSDYVNNIYNPELLSPGDVEILPELHRFGYFMTLAFTAKNEGDLVSYVRLMKEALRLCESMKNVVSFYLSELEEEMKQ